MLISFLKEGGGLKKDDQLYIYAEEDVTKALWKLSIPAMLSSVIQIIYNMINSFYIARLDNVAMLAAVTVSSTVNMAPNAFASAIGIGACSYISRQLGEKSDNIHETVKTSMTMTFVVYAGVLIACFTLLDPVLSFLNDDPEVFKYSKIYSMIFLVSTLFSMLKQICINLLRTEGDIVYPTFVFFVSAVLNVIIAPFLMYSWGLNLQIAGAALATALSTLLTALMLMHRLCFKTKYVKWNLFEFGIDRTAASEIVKVGSAVFIRDFLPNFSNATFTKAVGLFGTTFVAGAGVGKRASRLGINLIQGASKGFLPFVAYNYGAKNHKRLKEGIVKLTIAMTGIAVLFSVAFMLIPEIICQFYVTDKTAMVYAVNTLRYFTISMMAMGLYNVMLSSLQGMGRNKDSMIVSIARGVAYYIPIVYILPRTIGMTGIYLAQPITDWLTIFTLLFIAKDAIRTIFFKNSTMKKEA